MQHWPSATVGRRNRARESSLHETRNALPMQSATRGERAGTRSQVKRRDRGKERAAPRRHSQDGTDSIGGRGPRARPRAPAHAQKPRRRPPHASGGGKPLAVHERCVLCCSPQCPPPGQCARSYEVAEALVKASARLLALRTHLLHPQAPFKPLRSFRPNGKQWEYGCETLWHVPLALPV